VDIVGNLERVGARLQEMASAFVVSSVTFGTWQTWWLCTIWIAVALTALLLKPQNTSLFSDTQTD
jgi:hypothetical protein